MGSSALPSLAHPCWAEITTIKMPRRERPAKSNQNGGSDDDPAVAVAEIPRKSAPLRRRVLQPRSRGHDNLLCEPTRSGPRSALMGSSAKDTNRISDASIVRVHGSLGPTNSSERQQFSEFPAQVRVKSEKICPRLQLERKTKSSTSDDDAILGDV